MEYDKEWISLILYKTLPFNLLETGDF
jgi:hypothetical protein